MNLIQWAIFTLAAAVVAGLLGFSGVSSGTASISKVLFTLFMILAAFLFLFSLFGVPILI